MTELTLKAYMSRPPVVPTGRKILSYETDQFPFQAAALAYLKRVIPGIKCEDLTQAHHHVPAEMKVRTKERINGVSVRLSPEETPELAPLFYKFVQHLARTVFNEDLVFEARPQFRFVFPIREADDYRRRDGNLACQHSDLMLGDYFEQTNCWLPLTRCFGSNSLQICDFPSSVDLEAEFARIHSLDLSDFYNSRKTFFREPDTNDAYYAKVNAACKPLVIDYGQLLMFDPRVLHGTAENAEDSTRVSIDFRLLTVSQYEVAVADRERLNQTKMSVVSFEDESLTKGGYYHASTALELEVG